MKKESVIEFLILIGVAVGGFFFLKKSKPKTDASTAITQESATKAYLPETTIIKASQVKIPKTAVVLPTASSVVQSSSIQEEDINSLDCDSLFLKYNTINNQLVELVTTDGSNASNISLLKNRKSLIEAVMKNKKCVIPDPVLKSAVIESTIIAPPKYTNAEISQISETTVGDIINGLESSNSAMKYNVSSGNASGGEDTQIAQNNNTISRKYILITKLSDFLKTLSTKEDVNRFSILYPALLGFILRFAYIPQREDYKKQYISESDTLFLTKIGYKDDFIS